MHAFVTILSCVGLLYGLWVFYVAHTHLEKLAVAGEVSTVTRALSFVTKCIFLTLDTTANLTLVAVLFFDPPRELLVTTRLIRYMKGKDGWRKRVTAWTGKHLLDAFDVEGDHLKY